MKFQWTLFAILALLCVGVARAEEEEAEEESKVIVLDEATFEEELAKHTYALVEFYAPWCGHCKRLAPEYEKAAKELDGKGFGVLAKVDCIEEKDLCSKHDIKGFPTLKLFHEGKNPTEYPASLPRKADAIVGFLKKKNQPPVVDLKDEEAVREFAKDAKVSVIAFIGEEHVEERKVLTAVARENEDFLFGAVADEATAAAFKVKQPAILALRKFDDPEVTFEGGLLAKEELSEWIVGISFPFVGEIGPDNYQQYMKRGLPFFWMFLDPANEEQTKLLEVVTPVAKDFATLVSFVHLDGVRWAEHGKRFGLSGETPGIVLEDNKANKKYIFDESKEVTAEAVREFVEAYKAGTLSPHIKSEPVPEENDEGVFTLVGLQFDEIVMDEKKDVLVEFYAPWCGHCKKLKPEYEKLGEEFEEDSTMVIAAMDATQNDHPAPVRGFPTLIYYPANDKANPISYSGARTAKAIAAWLNEHRTVGVEKEEEVEEKEEEKKETLKEEL